MRELKFRAWDIDKQEYITYFDISSEGCVWTQEPCCSPDYPNVIIEQYTGLQDRGVEIYEGDIVRWANSVGREITAPVVWNTRAWCWTAGDYMLGGLLEFDLEVVGNIHEDLKLLEAKE